MSSRDEGPVYYREIQKCAYLTRITHEVSASKLRPLGVKKAVNKPMWTQFCVHNGKTPYLEQYPEQDSSATHSHKPLWKVCLKTARHITASVKPHTGDQYDFLIDTENGSVRMLAQDWDSMQDWVTTLRSTLHELKIISRGENVYCGPPAPPPAPRAPARDPMSPLPPTPPVPPDRVPGIDLTPNVRNQATFPTQDPVSRTPDPTRPQDSATRPSEPQTRSQDPTSRQPDPISRSQDSAFRPQDSAFRPQDSTTRPQDSATRPQDTAFRPQDAATRPHATRLGNLNDQTNTTTEEAVDISIWDTPFSSLPSTSQTRSEPSRSVAKICGQNICLDDSICKRTSDGTNDFFADIGSASDVEDVDIDNGFKQRLIVSEKNDATDDNSVSNQASNITVIQVSNKGAPHTAIPILGPETNIFDFEFREKLTQKSDPNFVNIINTEHNAYDTTFTKSESRNDLENAAFSPDESLSNDKNLYGHISLTTTVNLTCSVTTGEDMYERLCMASTSEPKASPATVRRIKNMEISRKSSLPNLEANDTYEYLFLSNNNVADEFNSNADIAPIGLVNGHVNRINNDPVNRVNQTNSPVNRVNQTNSPVNRVNMINNESLSRENSLKNNVNTSTSTHNTNRVNTVRVNDSVNRLNASNDPVNRVNIPNDPVNRVNIQNDPVNTANESVNRVNTTNDAANTITSVERSRSQNAYDSAPRTRDNVVRRVQNGSPKREIKNDKAEPTPKPKWKRGFTELSLLTRLAIGQVRRQESPTRQETIVRQNSPGRPEVTERCGPVTSPVSVLHRSRPEVRVDASRRRSSSLSNGEPPLSIPPNLQPLRARQAAALRAEQRRGAALVAPVPTRQPPIFADYNKQVWVAWWGVASARWMGRAGDRVCAVRGLAPRDAAHARQLVLTTHAPLVDVLFHRVPLANIYVVNKRENETLGIKLDNECNITNVESDKTAGRAGLPPPGKWALTEVNNRPLNILKGGEDDMNRLSMHGAEVSLLIQPSSLVKKLRAALKANKALLR